MLESTFAEIKFILNFNCSEEILVQRLLHRGKKYTLIWKDSFRIDFRTSRWQWRNN